MRGFWGVVIDKNGGNYGEHASYSNGVNPAGGCFAVRTRISTTAFRTDFMIRNNGNVGIGTISPASKLGILGNLSIGATYSTTAAPTSGLIVEGKVGIGTTNPQKALEVNGDISLANCGGTKSIYMWAPVDENWRIGMGTGSSFSRALATSHIQYITYNSSVGQGFAVGVNGGNSSFEIRGSDHQAYFRGNIGIGTTAPLSKLGILGNASIGATYNAINAPASGLIVEGNVGIGNSAPTEKLEVTGNVKVNGGNISVSGDVIVLNNHGVITSGVQLRSSDVKKFGIYNDHWNTSSRQVFFMPANAAGTDWDWGKELVIDGVDGIMMKSVTDTSTKAFRVYQTSISKDVFRVMGDGKVYATEVNVLLAANFPDYVFAKDYKLMNLSDLEQYINANKHLPGVPSAKEVASNGNSINLGEMQTILLEKIEGLTLYTIEQQKQMSIQQKQIDAQKELLQKQQATIDLLMQKLQE